MSPGRLDIAQGGPSFAAVLAGQVLWGIGYTFTSGAKEAWVTDEVGEEQMAPVFLHGTQVDLGGVPPAAMGYSRFGIMHYPPLIRGRHRRHASIRSPFVPSALHQNRRPSCVS